MSQVESPEAGLAALGLHLLFCQHGDADSAEDIVVGRHLYLLGQDALEGGFHRPVKGGPALEKDVVADLAVFHYFGKVVFHDGVGKSGDQVFLGAEALEATAPQPLSWAERLETALELARADGDAAVGVDVGATLVKLAVRTDDGLPRQARGLLPRRAGVPQT